jgi:hypothetical protein
MPETKLPYKKPTLTEFGSLREITLSLGNPNAAADGMGGEGMQKTRA